MVRKYELPEKLQSDWALVDIGCPEPGEYFVNRRGFVEKCVTPRLIDHYPIVTKKPKPKIPWPDYLASGWLAENIDGSWFWFPKEPTLSADQVWVGEKSVDFDSICLACPEVEHISLPDCRYEDSLVEVGNHEKH